VASFFLLFFEFLFRPPSLSTPLPPASLSLSLPLSPPLPFSSLTWHWLRKALAASGPSSAQITCTSDPALAPSVFLHSVPVSSCPPWISTCESVGLMSAGSPSRYHDVVRRQLTPGGKNALINCLPVQRGLGLSSAGIGTRPSQSSSHIIMLNATSFSMNESRAVMRRHPRRVSCVFWFGYGWWWSEKEREKKGEFFPSSFKRRSAATAKSQLSSLSLSPSLPLSPTLLSPARSRSRACSPAATRCSSAPP